MSRLVLLTVMAGLVCSAVGPAIADVPAAQQLVSDGQTPVPFPDGSGRMIVPPAGIPLPLTIDLDMVDYPGPPHGMSADPVPGTTISDASQAYLLDDAVMGLSPLPFESEDASGAQTAGVGCISYHAGWDQYQASAYKGASTSIILSGLHSQ